MWNRQCFEGLKWRSGYIPHEKQLLDFCIYSWIQYELSLGFKPHNIHLSEPRSSAELWASFWRRISETHSLELRRRWFAGVFSHLLVVRSLCEGFVVLTSPGQGVHPPHPDVLLGQVSGQSSVVNLLHVLLDFSFGVLQQVCLTLKQKWRKAMGHLISFPKVSDECFQDFLMWQ